MYYACLYKVYELHDEQGYYFRLYFVLFALLQIKLELVFIWRELFFI